jgi:hypothetical protein
VIAASRCGRRVAASLVFAVLFAACGSTAPTPGASGTASPSSGSATGSPALATPATSATPPPSTLVAIDPGLLDLLPESVAGLPLEESPEAAAESVTNEALAASAESIAVALVVDPATESFAVASVVRLRPGVFDDEFFRDWRDSFDEGVCAQAGGVSGNAEAELDGRTVYIGTCAGGVHTYHVHLEGQDVLVSVNSVGESRLGEELMETLPD